MNMYVLKKQWRDMPIPGNTVYNTCPPCAKTPTTNVFYCCVQISLTIISFAIHCHRKCGDRTHTHRRCWPILFSILPESVRIKAYTIFTRYKTITVKVLSIEIVVSSHLMKTSTNRLELLGDKWNISVMPYTNRYRLHLQLEFLLFKKVAFVLREISFLSAETVKHPKKY